MALIQLDKDNFNDVIHDNEIVFIGFLEDGNDHCREVEELFEVCSNGHPDVVFATCDVREVPEAAESFAIAEIPTVVVFRDQVMLFSEPSSKRSGWLRSQDRLEKAVHKIRELDMAQVKSEPAAIEPSDAG